MHLKDVINIVTIQLIIKRNIFIKPKLNVFTKTSLNRLIDKMTENSTKNSVNQ